MKNNNFVSKSLIMVLILALLISCKAEFVKLPEHKTDKSKIEFAVKIANSFFTTLKNGDSFNFNNNATKSFSLKMTPDFQKQIYGQIKSTFGNFESLTYSSTWEENGNTDLQIIRLKGNFEKSEAPLEIRIVLNNSYKITGLWVKPWRNNLSSF